MLLVASLPIIVISGVFRIVFQACALHYWMIDFTAGKSHDFLGMAAFVLSLVLLYLAWQFIRWVLNHQDVANVGVS